MQTILIQEDDASIREVLTIFLEMVGFRVKALRTCDKELLDLIEQFDPLLVMLDFSFLGTATSAMCKQIKFLWPDLPVLAMSCNSNIGELYKQLGFDDFVAKPFDLDLLERKLKYYGLSREWIDHQK